MSKEEKKQSYCGQILNGNFSREAKRRVTHCIENFNQLDNLGVPIIPYISAWQDNQKEIWYEFVSDRFLDLLDCNSYEAADVFRNSIIERRIYKYIDAGSGIHEEVVGLQELHNERQEIREASKDKGMIDAVYKINTPCETKPFWLKDQAIIEFLEQDNTCLSLGSLTVVTKEMEAEEEREKLVIKLQEAFANIKTLRGFLPICSNCKKIRDDKGYWNQIESYISTHTDVDFSHGICPECARQLYPDFDHDKFEGA